MRVAEKGMLRGGEEGEGRKLRSVWMTPYELKSRDR